MKQQCGSASFPYIGKRKWYLFLKYLELEEEKNEGQSKNNASPFGTIKLMKKYHDPIRVLS